MTVHPLKRFADLWQEMATEVKQAAPHIDFHHLDSLANQVRTEEAQEVEKTDGTTTTGTTAADTTGATGVTLPDQSGPAGKTSLNDGTPTEAPQKDGIVGTADETSASSPVGDSATVPQPHPATTDDGTPQPSV